MGRRVSETAVPAEIARSFGVRLGELFGWHLGAPGPPRLVPAEDTLVEAAGVRYEAEGRTS